jgi:hypothetical protein
LELNPSPSIAASSGQEYLAYWHNVQHFVYHKIYLYPDN